MIEDWDELIAIFVEDDGSLPDIELNQLTGEEVIEGYEFVRKQSTHISSKEPHYWSKNRDCEVPILFEDNPSRLVVSGDAEPFHLCFDGIHSPSGKAIPELGLFVYSDGLSFDYRMGPQWNIEAVEGLIEFIAEMSRGYKSMQITHKTNINDIDGAIFEAHWEAYKNA